MSQEAKDAMTTSHLLNEKAYRDTLKLDKRKALYQYTSPHFNIEDEVLGLSFLESNQVLLDVGCGTGKLLLNAAVAIPGAKLVGVDLSAGMFQAAQQRSQEEELDIQFQTGDVQELPFSDGSFDRVTAMHMLYHAPDIHKAIGELARVVKSDGIVLITVNSINSRRQLRLLKEQAASTMRREVFTDPNMRFNLEHGLEMVAEHFANVALVPFESTLRLTKAQPYVDYFDSLREFWQPTPSDAEWATVITDIRQYVEEQITQYGRFTDRLGFGVIIASASPIPARLLQRGVEEH